MTVTQLAKRYKQPQEGFIPPSNLKEISFNDGMNLTQNENIAPNKVGLVVDYLTRLMLGYKVKEAFDTSLKGADIAYREGYKNAKVIAKQLISGINGIDEKSVINACKIVDFDDWYRNPNKAKWTVESNQNIPDTDTINNIQIMVKRCINFFSEYGPVTKIGFRFESENDCDDGGYTPTVSDGEGDYLTKDTMWDLKVSKYSPDEKNTLQLLMYLIMGIHSKRKEFKKLTKLGIFNPRLNRVYTINTSDIPAITICRVEIEVIRY